MVSVGKQPRQIASTNSDGAGVGESNRGNHASGNGADSEGAGPLSWLKPFNSIFLGGTIVAGTAALLNFSDEIEDFVKNPNLKVVTGRDGRAPSVIITKERDGEEPTLRGVLSGIRAQYGGRSHQPAVETLSFNNLGWNDKDFGAVLAKFPGGIETIEFNGCGAFSGACFDELPAVKHVVIRSAAFKPANVSRLIKSNPEVLSINIDSQSIIAGLPDSFWTSLEHMGLQRLYITVSGSPGGMPPGVEHSFFQESKRLAATGPNVEVMSGLGHKSFPGRLVQVGHNKDGDASEADVPLPKTNTLTNSGL